MGGAGETVDGRNPAPPKKPWNDDSPANTNKPYGFPFSVRGAKRMSQPSTVGILVNPANQGETARGNQSWVA